MTMILDLGRFSDDAIEAYMALCPFVQAPAIMEAFARGPGVRPNVWPLLHLDSNESTVLVLTTTGMYVAIGLLFAWRAARNLRRRVF